MGLVDGMQASTFDDVDAALLRSAESDLRHAVEANPPGYRSRPLEAALRNVQALMAAHGIARNVGGQLVPPGVRALDESRPE